MANLTEEQVRESLLKILGVGQKTQATGTPSTPYYHGPGGIFGVQGLSRDLISTRINPIGLASQLPVVMTNEMNPLYGYISGFRAGSGDFPEGVCDDTKKPGPIKTCFQTAVFGRWSESTRELEINRIGQTINRGEFFDLNLENDPLVAELGGIFPGLPTAQTMLVGREVLARMLEVGQDLQNWLCPILYTGNPANNHAGGGYAEPPGLDILIGVNKIDALTMTPCPSLRSIIWDMDYEMIDHEAGIHLIRVVTETFRQFQHIVSRTNLGPCSWDLVMREDLFYLLTAIWPCSYLTDRCGFATASEGNLVVMANDQVRMRDEMRSGQYLLVDGVQVHVQIDDAIVEEDHGDNGEISLGCFASDIYVVPRTYRGGRPALFWEVFNYSDGPMQAVQDSHAVPFFWTDGGRYLWTYDVKAWCLVHTVKMEPRLILRTPHIAARILNVQYCPLMHSRDPFIGQDYYVDGGESGRPEIPFYGDWDVSPQ